MTSPSQLQAACAPRHVAIIMDGNGRWAESRGLPRAEGHRRGVEAVRRSVRAALKFGVETLTIFSFSTENWRRPPEEVALLMGLLRRYIRNDLADLHSRGVRVRVIGERAGLTADIVALIEEAEHLTAGNVVLTLVVAFNYGGRQEIAAAARRLAEEALSGALDPRSIDDATFAARLFTADIPDPDLIVRTSGEQRLSNFLLWQAAYSEFVFIPVHWPDFDEAHFAEALEAFRARERRFGETGAQRSKRA
jgi:undecaprenyl diphosphate synthase